MRRVIVVVARDRAELYDYLRRGFDGVDGVQVILDRRVHVSGNPIPEGIDSERRRDIMTYEELQLRGFIIRPAS